MINVNLKNNKGFKYTTLKQSYYKGFIYDEYGKKYMGLDMGCYFGEVSNESEFKKKLIEANGSFVVAMDDDKYTYIGMDRTRSFPIFYTKCNQEYYFSDDANYLLSILDNENIGIDKVKEFKAKGYISGNSTLFPEIKELSTGQYGIYNKMEKKLKINTYYKLKHELDENKCYETNIIEKMDENYMNSFKRLIDSLEGRTAVIPLSGGCDSRCIAVMLKKLNYGKVICYSYGKKGNEESKVSQKIAQKLGFKWIFIEYTDEKWKEWSNSEEWKKYFLFSGNLSTTPVIQDWSAVYEMKKRKLIPLDSVFIPGYSGDMIAGSHIPIEFAKIKNISKTFMQNVILSKYFSLQPLSSFKKEDFRIFKNLLNEEIDLKDNYTNIEAGDIIERYDFEGRQIKFINNAVRVYEFFEYEWRTPLWDLEILNFWINVKMNLRVNRKLYYEYDRIKCVEYINSLDNKYEDVVIKYDNQQYNLKYRCKTLLLKLNFLLAYKMLNKIKDKFNNKKNIINYENHFLKWNVLMGYDGYKKLKNIYSYLSLYYLENYIQRLLKK